MISLTDVTSRFKASLLDSVRSFDDAAYPRHIQAAMAALNAVRPQHLVTVVSLVAGRSLYPCPQKLTAIHACWWGRSAKYHTEPWADHHPGRLPEWSIANNEAGVRFLRAMPAPTAWQINSLGSECELEYHADHVLTDTECTLSAEDLDLLIVRAQAEAMREVSMKNATTAYQLRESIGSTPNNSTPAHLYTQLMAEFERRAGR